MNSKIIISIAIVISVIATAGIMYTMDTYQQPQIVQIPESETIYVNKGVSEYFEGTNEIKKISSQQELQNILEASSSFNGSFDTRILRTFATDDAMMMGETAESIGVSKAVPMQTDEAYKVE